MFKFYAYQGMVGTQQLVWKNKYPFISFFLLKKDSLLCLLTNLLCGVILLSIRLMNKSGWLGVWNCLLSLKFGKPCWNFGVTPRFLVFVRSIKTLFFYSCPQTREVVHTSLDKTQLYKENISWIWRQFWIHFFLIYDSSLHGLKICYTVSRPYIKNYNVNITDFNNAKRFTKTPSLKNGLFF